MVWYDRQIILASLLKDSQNVFEHRNKAIREQSENCRNYPLQQRINLVAQAIGNCFKFSTCLYLPCSLVQLIPQFYRGLLVLFLVSMSDSESNRSFFLAYFLCLCFKAFPWQPIFANIYYFFILEITWCLFYMIW